jgi:hypothetical protein
VTNHTPGPWRVGRGDKKQVYSDHGGECLVAECQSCGDSVSEAYANARLVAAAPDLLAACKTAYKRLERFGEHATIAYGGEGGLSAILWAAIAEAEGGGE